MKRTTLTPPPLKSLKIAIVSAILGLGAMSTVHAQAQNNIDTEMDKILNAIDQISKLSDEEKKVRKNIVRLSYGLNNTSSQIGDNRTAIEENKASLSTLTRKSFQNQADIVRNNASIEDLYDFGHEVAKHLEEVSEYNERQTDAIDTLNKASSANADRITTAELGIAENKKGALIAKAQADKNRNHIKELANAQLESVTFLGEQIQENKDDIANNINNIHELAQQQDQHSSDIKTLAKASAANKADADAKFKGVQTDIANNKITLANHAKKINDNQKAIEAKLGGKKKKKKLAELKTNVDKNQADIADNINNIHKLAQQQDQHGSDIRTLAKAGITNKDAIAKNTQSITTLDNKVNTFDGRISALDAKVNGFDGRINALDDKVENSMAAQAALNGLFQPYNVGKVSVSAAVGAYGSKSAIAVGAGYRVNPHLAFKGGAAINTSGSRKGSYNLGINYEF